MPAVCKGETCSQAYFCQSFVICVGQAETVLVGQAADCCDRLAHGDQAQSASRHNLPGLSRANIQIELLPTYRMPHASWPKFNCAGTPCVVASNSLDTSGAFKQVLLVSRNMPSVLENMPHCLKEDLTSFETEERRCLATHVVACFMCDVCIHIA